MIDIIESIVGQILFFIGYILSAVSTVTVTLTVALVMAIGIRMKIEACREIYDDMIFLSEKTFDVFLNQLQAFFTDKFRKTMAYAQGCW